MARRKGDYMAKYKDILGNIRECEDKTITISLADYVILDYKAICNVVL